jgi:hypothetical protein
MDHVLSADIYYSLVASRVFVSLASGVMHVTINSFVGNVCQNLVAPCTIVVIGGVNVQVVRRLPNTYPQKSRQ